MPFRHAIDLDAALRQLVVDSARLAASHELARPKLIVVPNGPDCFLLPAVTRFWPMNSGTANSPRPVYVPARDVEQQGAFPAIEIFSEPSVVFFEPLDEIEFNQPAQEALTNIIDRCASSRTLVFISYSRKLPEAMMDMNDRLMAFLLNRGSFDVNDWSIYSEAVRNRQDFYIRERIKSKIDAMPSLRSLGGNGRSRLVEELTDVAIQIMRENTAIKDHFLIDQDTGLKLPPDARTPYQHRIVKYGKKISVSEFLKLEWGDYTRHYLLYAEHIRERDPALYKALHYQARADGVKFSDFLFRHGIFGKDHLVEPPRGYERQAKVLQALRLQSRSLALERIARDHLSTLRLPPNSTLLHKSLK